MSDKSLKTFRIAVLLIVAVIMVVTGLDFYNHRNYRETVVKGPAVVSVKKLSDYYAPMKGSVNDTNVYILDSGIPGGTGLIIGGTHPEEPSANLGAEIIMENAKLDSGKLIVVLRANKSASMVTRPGDAYPMYYEIPTNWGVKKYRMGDRWSSPLDSWPDPEVYVNYPSGQLLAYMDVRNFNRTWPGRTDGLITEKTSYAFIELIKKEKVDIFIDFHEAELEYPVISTIVAHQDAADIAAMSSMMLTATEFKIGMEFSPPSLHGLSHREVGDHSDAVSLLFETPEPFLDRVRGKTDVRLLLEGRDEFVMKAGEAGLLYEKIDENGWPIATRVARQVATTQMVLDTWSDFNPDKEIRMVNLPSYSELKDNGVGKYLKDPSSVSKEDLYYE